MRCESNHHESGYCPSQHIAPDGCYCDCHNLDEDPETFYGKGDEEGEPLPNSIFVPASAPTTTLDTWVLAPAARPVVQDLAGNWYLLDHVTRDHNQRVRLFGWPVDASGNPRKGARLAECLRDEA